MVIYAGPTPRFTPAHRWSFKNNAICGICLGQWLPLLWCYRAHVEWRAYWQRVAFVTILAGLNSLLASIEEVLHGRSIARQRIHPRPLFVLGHPRTGTTLLHSLLALDDELGTCSTFCAGFPSSFLLGAKSRHSPHKTTAGTRYQHATAALLGLQARLQ